MTLFDKFNGMQLFLYVLLVLVTQHMNEWLVLYFFVAILFDSCRESLKNTTTIVSELSVSTDELIIPETSSESSNIDSESFRLLQVKASSWDSLLIQSEIQQMDPSKTFQKFFDRASVPSKAIIHAILSQKPNLLYETKLSWWVSW